MTQSFQELKTAVEEHNTVEAGVEEAINGVAVRIDELLNALQAAQDDPAEVAALTEQMRAHTAELRASAGVLAAAVVKGTPAENPPAPAPAPAPVTTVEGEPV